MKGLRSLALLGVVSFATLTYAGQGMSQGMGMMMKHTNPMPNLMQVVVHQGDKLNLTEEQDKALAAWRTRSHDRVHDLVKQVIEVEKEINQAAMSGEHKASIMAKTEKMLSLRRQIIDTKTNCRDNMRRILNEEQWQQLISLYQAANPS